MGWGKGIRHDQAQPDPLADVAPGPHRTLNADHKDASSYWRGRAPGSSRKRRQ